MSVDSYIQRIQKIASESGRSLSDEEARDILLRTAEAIKELYNYQQQNGRE